ncbi:MAG: MBL fold metallo-hydrolase [Candidatus Omnitrophica bacterium]|nr:MBL fold metallo-hydrolase [Candidatus Omnitrophota bacterium]
MIFKKIVVGALEVNCYILGDEFSRKAILIDPGADVEKISALLKKANLRPQIIINTHGHFDHIGSDNAWNIPIYIHKDDAELLSNAEKNFSAWMGAPFKISSSNVKFLKDKDWIEVGEIGLEVMHTPGHTPGGICLLLRRHSPMIIFTGDTLFKGSIGRTDIAGASEELLLNSIKDKVLNLSDETIVCPGHGPESNIGIERWQNPFLI